MIGIYIINRTLHGRLEIRNFCSRVENYFPSERNFVSPRGHVIFSIYYELVKLSTLQKLYMLRDS